MTSSNQSANFLSNLSLTMRHLDMRNPGDSDLEHEARRNRWYYRIMYLSQSDESITPNPSYCTTSNMVFAATSPFTKLERSNIKELRLGESARGKYLVLRTIERACKSVGIMTIVEDHLGNVTFFAAYNNFCSDFNANPEEVMPVGTVFILKEPYFKVPLAAFRQCYRHYMLRCDCPTDIIVLNESHPLFSLTSDIQWKNDLSSPCVNPVLALPRPQGAQEWKLRGNELFKAGKIEYAKECYLMALKNIEDSDELCQVLRLNLAACHLRLHCFEDVLIVTTKILLVEPENQKALFRAGRACYELRKYRDAMKYYEKLHKMNPENKEWTQEWKRAKNRMDEEETGNVSIYRLFLERSLKPRQKIDCGDFVGPVKVVPLHGKGRGVVVTEDIEPGRLLVVSKAFKISWTEPGEFYRQLNSDMTYDLGDNLKLVSEVAEAVMKNPHTFGCLVYDLSLGKHEEEYRNYLKLFCDPDTEKEPIADIQCIKYILNANAFGVGNVQSSDYSTVLKSQLEKIDLVCGSGLFLYPSYFNHSCLANAYWTIYNDIMVIRATQFIKQGEEVSNFYFSPIMERKEKEKHLQFRGFKCSCNLCNYFEQEPANLRSKRERLMTDFKTNMEPQFNLNPCVTRRMVERLEKLVSDVEATYTKDAEKNFSKMEMVLLFKYLQECYSRQNRYVKAIAVGFKKVACFGFDPLKLIRIGDETEKLSILSEGFLTFALLYEIISLAFVCFEAGRSEDMKKWIKVVKVLHGILTGGDYKCFKLSFPSVADFI